MGIYLQAQAHGATCRYTVLTFTNAQIFFLVPSSSTLIRFFMFWLWQQLSSIFTACRTCRSSATALREDVQMTHYSESLTVTYSYFSF